MVAVHLGQTLGFGHEVGTGHNQHVGCRQAMQVLVGHGFKARNLVERERGVESHKLGGRAALAGRESHAHCLTLAVDHCRQVHLGYVQGVGDVPHQCLAACSGHYHLDCVAQHGVTHVEATGFLAGIAIGVLIGHGGIVAVSSMLKTRVGSAGLKWRCTSSFSTYQMVLSSAVKSRLTVVSRVVNEA